MYSELWYTFMWNGGDNLVNVNDYKGYSDNEIIDNAIRNKTKDGIVIIPPRNSKDEPTRDWWLLDRAILIPENTTIILQNCKIKLSDRCRDNFFRTANCGMGISYPEKIKNVHIKGEGLCVLEGADHPRATGDAGKMIVCPCPYETKDLCEMADWIPHEDKENGNIKFWDKHNHTYGTDFGKQNESQYGDWRNIGILFANASDFSIENIKIVESHGWGISLEACSYGELRKIDFDARMWKQIDAMKQNIENQDGVDIRNGCHDIIISDITGHTGDDMIALTAIAKDIVRLGGELKSAHVMHTDWSKRDKNIHNIIIRNVKGYSSLCYMVRLLPANTKIWNVVIDGVVDTSSDSINNFGCIMLGTADEGYGKNNTDGMKNITVSNVISNSQESVVIAGYINDSVISNVINRNPGCPCISIRRENGMINVQTSALCSAGEETMELKEAPKEYPV